MSDRAQRTATVVAAAALLGSAACTGLMAQARPDAPASAEALKAEDEACAAKGEDGAKAPVPDVGKPLVVDLQASERGDLEVAMRESILVVGYDCNRLRILDECRLEGSYGYAGFVPKEELVRLADAEELGANLPISAGPFGAKLAGDFERGMTLDIAMMMVGKSRTTKRVARRGDLVEDRPGACATATHFVRGVTHGAFAMTTGTRAEARAVADVFGIPKLGEVGVRGGSSSAEDVSRKDGSLDACKGAPADATAPTPSCSAILRLELSRIVDDGSAATAASPAAPAAIELTGEVCGAGLVFAAGKCTAPTADVPHLCKVADVEDCKVQCDKGDGGSCSRLGWFHQSGKHGFAPDPSKAAAMYAKGCELGSALACGSLAGLHSVGEGVPKDPVKTEQLAKRSCDGGFEPACFVLGAALFMGNGVKRDPEKAVGYLHRACHGGMPQGCFLLGEASRRGAGAPKDPARALALYRRGCEGDDPLACYAVGVAFEDGIGTAKDRAAARPYFERACDAGMPEACKALGR